MNDNPAIISARHMHVLTRACEEVVDLRGIIYALDLINSMERDSIVKDDAIDCLIPMVRTRIVTVLELLITISPTTINDEAVLAAIGHGKGGEA